MKYSEQHISSYHYQVNNLMFQTCDVIYHKVFCPLEKEDTPFLPNCKIVIINDLCCLTAG